MYMDGDVAWWFYLWRDFWFRNRLDKIHMIYQEKDEILHPLVFAVDEDRWRFVRNQVPALFQHPYKQLLLIPIQV